MFQFCTSSSNSQLLKLHILQVLSHHAKWDSSEPPQPWYFWQSNFIQIKNIIKILAMGTEIMQNFLFHNFVTRWRILTWFGSTLKETEPTWTIFGLETSQTLALASSSFRFSPNCQIPSNCVISVSCSFSVSLSLSLSRAHTHSLFETHLCSLPLSHLSQSQNWHPSVWRRNWFNFLFPQNRFLRQKVAEKLNFSSSVVFASSTISHFSLRKRQKRVSTD